jgi:hypothetical protein
VTAGGQSVRYWQLDLSNGGAHNTDFFLEPYLSAIFVCWGWGRREMEKKENRQKRKSEKMKNDKKEKKRKEISRGKGEILSLCMLQETR